MSNGYIIGGGGGGSGLALKVIGSPTQPSNPKYPTIWAQTDVPISQWEISTVNAPNLGAPTGFVYLTTKTTAWDDSNYKFYNALKKNCILLSTYVCWQNTGTVDAPQWRTLNAWLYSRNNEWVQISTTSLVLFDASLGGDQTAVTGGWNTTAGNINFGGVDATKVWAGATGYGGYRTTTKKAIDITLYSTLKAIGTMTCEGRGAYPSWGVDNGASQSGSGNISNTSREYVIDVSNVTGAHTIYLAGAGTFTSDRAWIGTVTFTYMELLA